MYLVPTKRGCAELIVKRSRFICTLDYASSKTEALATVAEQQRHYPDARHVCYGFKIGGASQVRELGFNDDGEPSGTAGKPILNVLQHSDLGDTVAIVVRYFGGIKLGAGGLVRAYSNVTSECLASLSTHTFDPPLSQSLVFDYPLESAIRQCLAKHSATVLDCHYQQRVQLEWSVGTQQADSLAASLIALDHTLASALRRS